MQSQPPSTYDNEGGGRYWAMEADLAPAALAR